MVLLKRIPKSEDAAQGLWVYTLDKLRVSMLQLLYNTSKADIALMPIRVQPVNLLYMYAIRKCTVGIQQF